MYRHITDRPIARSPGRPIETPWTLAALSSRARISKSKLYQRPIATLVDENDATLNIALSNDSQYVQQNKRKSTKWVSSYRVDWEKTALPKRRASTRSICMLLRAQLHRKRTSDRDAQRTIRQRTREHIRSLETQVTELRARDEQLQACYSIIGLSRSKYFS